MPDLVTHTALGYFVVRGWKRAAPAFLFLIGNMLPDLATRPAYILFPPSYWWVYPMHTPLGVLLLIWGTTGLFRRTDRRTVFLSLTAGALVHFALDSLQRHAGMGYLWLSPFSWGSTNWGLFRPEDALSWLPVFLGAVVLFESGLRAVGKLRKAKGAGGA